MTINRFKIVAVLVAISIITMSCKKTPKATFTSDAINYFGEQIDTSGAMALSALPLALPEGDTLDVKVLANIDNVCQKKGCWMNIKALSESDRKVFVRFKDYEFFVPLDAGGRRAVVSGKLYSNVTSVDELRHYAEDEGKSKEEIESITEPKVELRMMADGVAIL